MTSSDRKGRRVDWFWRRFRNQEEALATRRGFAGGDVGINGRSHWIERSHKFFRLRVLRRAKVSITSDLAFVGFWEIVLRS